jgi:hypothetical protein
VQKLAKDRTTPTPLYAPVLNALVSEYWSELTTGDSYAGRREH